MAFVHDLKHQICTHHQTYLESILLTIYQARELNSLFYSIFRGAAPIKLKISCVIISELAWAPFSKRGRTEAKGKAFGMKGIFFNSRLNKIHLLMYRFLLALIEKRWFCTSKQTLLTFFAFLAEILKSPLCTRCQGSEVFNKLTLT